MLSNILRILLSRVLFHETMKEREMLEKQIKEKREVDEAENMSLDKRIEAIRERAKYRERFCVRPIMAETYEINMLMAHKIGIIVAIAFTIFVIGAIVYLLFFDNAVYYPSELKYIELMKTGGVMVTATMFIWILVGLFKFAHKYMKETKYIFYQNRICIRRLWKKEKVVTYEELSRYIEKKKVRVHNGRFEFSYKGGRIPVYTWGDEPTSPEFYQFINEQCGTNIPSITKEDNEIVRKTGSGWILYTYFSLPLFAIGLFAGIMSTIGDYGINHSLIEMLDYFIDYFFSIANIFSIIGLMCALIGFILKLRSYFPAKNHFAKYKDTVKVSLF